MLVVSLELMLAVRGKPTSPGWSIESYITALSCVGTAPVAALPHPYVEQQAALASGILITGVWNPGPDIDDNPLDEEWIRQLIYAAARHGLPMLGICFGAQLINCVLGGSVTPIQGHCPDRGTVQTLVSYARQSRLERCMHGWAIHQPGVGVRPLGHAEHGVIEHYRVDPVAASKVLPGLRPDAWITGTLFHIDLADDHPAHPVVMEFAAQCRAAQIRRLHGGLAAL